VAWLVERLHLPLVITARHRVPNLHRPGIWLEVHKPTLSSSVTCGASCSAPSGRAGADLDAPASQFRLSMPAIRAAYSEAIGRNQLMQRKSRLRSAPAALRLRRA
jgi:hypothetical protein